MKNNIAIKVLLLCLPLLINSCSTNSDTIKTISGKTIQKETVDDFITSYMKSKNMPGISYAIINDGEVVHHNVEGYAFIEEDIKVDSETIFEACSMSKSVFGFFVMTFVEDGTIDLDVPVYKYKPEPDPDIIGDERYKKITARMLLSHTSGFPNERENEEDGKLKIYFEPGTSFKYSGEGYRYLGEVIMHILNIDHAGFEAEFQKRVAQPLGMTHTVFIENDYTKPRKAEPYVPEGRVDWRNSYFYKKDIGVVSGASSVHSEPVDFSKWMIGIMNNKILSKESYDELLKIHSTINGVLPANYTLGFYKNQTPLGTIYGHGGDSIGFTSYFSIHKTKKWGYVLFSNSEFGQDLGMLLGIYLTTGLSFGWYYLLITIILLSIVILLTYGIKRILIRNKKLDELQRYHIINVSLILVSLVGLFSILFLTQIPQSSYGKTLIITGLFLLIGFISVKVIKSLIILRKQWNNARINTLKKLNYSLPQAFFIASIVLLIRFVLLGFNI